MANEQILTSKQVIERTAASLQPEDVAIVQKAFLYAENAHKDQYRKSGEPYIIHPIQVAGILADLELDASTVAAGFLHDVVEDSETTMEEIRFALCKARSNGNPCFIAIIIDAI